jgi:hypothetical protein
MSAKLNLKRNFHDSKKEDNMFAVFGELAEDSPKKSLKKTTANH